MSGINKVILVGHLGKDPDLRYLEGDVAVVSFPLATSEAFNKNGNRFDRTEWHNIVMWRGLAKSAFELLKKGELIYIEGKIQTRSFLDKDSIKKYSTEVIANYFTLLGKNNNLMKEEKELPVKPEAPIV